MAGFLGSAINGKSQSLMKRNFLLALSGVTAACVLERL